MVIAYVARINGKVKADIASGTPQDKEGAFWKAMELFEDIKHHSQG